MTRGAGGGTGGHVIPALAIANQLKNDYHAEVLFIGTARGIENRLVPAAGYPLHLVRVGALKNVSLKTRVNTAFDLPRALWDASRMLNEFAPDVVIGVGGYASGPAMLAALVKHIPTLAFEPNVVPGFANRLVARFVSGAAVHLGETAKYFRHGEVTGVPVRHAFFEIPAKPGGTPTVLVFGGIALLMRLRSRQARSGFRRRRSTIAVAVAATAAVHRTILEPGSIAPSIWSA